MESGRLFFDRSDDSVFRGSRTMMISMENGSRIGPFFSSPDDLFDDDDEQSPDKKRRLSSDQVHMLEKSFDRENKLEPERKTQLANKLGLQPRQVSVWFQNRRARSKTKQLERDYDLLKSSYDSLVSDFDSVVKQNDLLKSEVISLTEKLQGKEVIEMVLPGLGQNCDPLDDVSAQLSIKVEDRPSSGTSTVVDEEGPQFVDSGDSYFLDEDYPAGCVDPVDSIHSEVEALHWWVWS